MNSFKIADYRNGPSDFDRGYTLFLAVKPSMESSMPISIDFTEAGGVSSSFLHGFLAEIFSLVGLAKAKELVRFENVSKTQAAFLQKYIQDYKNLSPA
jgi:hypothetical protein